MSQPIDAFASLSVQEREALKSLAMLAATSGAGYVGQKLDVVRVLSALKGDTPPPGWLVDLAESVLKSINSPLFPRVWLPIAEGWLEKQGLSLSTLVSLAKRFAPFVDVDVEDEDPKRYLIAIATVLAERVLDGATRESFHGIVNCPECRFVFLV